MLCDRGTVPALREFTGVPAVVRWLKEPVLLQLWQRLQLRLGCNPWPGKFCMPWVWLKKGKKKRREKKRKEKKKKNRGKMLLAD